MPSDTTHPNGPSVRLVEDADGWRARLITTPARKSGKPRVKPIAANVAVYLQYHPQWRGVIAYDAFAESTVTLLPPPWHPVDAPVDLRTGEWTDTDTARTVNWLVRIENLDVSAQAVEAALAVVSGTRVVHPVRDYLSSIVWDKRPRLERMLPTHFATSDTPYSRGVGRRWMISLVARIFEPGCQVDCTLILESKKQGTGKTSAFRGLVPVAGWYQDSGIDLSNKDSLIALRNVWIYGLDELDSLRKGDVTRWKNFLSQTRDHYRPPYARRARDFPRQCGFCGTTNDEEYFIDRTGNRRFWPNRVLGQIDPSLIVRDRDQLWAEAVHCYRAGEKWHVDTPELRALCEGEQHARVQQDPWLTKIANWLVEPYETFEEDGDFGRKVLARRRYDPPNPGVLTGDAVRYAIGKDDDRITTQDSMRAAACLKELGYERGRLVSENGARVRCYQPAAPAAQGDLPLGGAP
jgi:putative DNA primase/helicase